MRLLPILLALALALHFGATLVYLTPINPVKVAVDGPVDRYMNPFFTQRWELFAPDPIVDTRTLLVSCRGDDVDTDWADVTTPLRELKYRWRLTPADRLERVHSAAIHLAYGKEDALAEKLRKRGDKATVSELDQARTREAELGKRLFARLASAACDRWVGAGRTREVAVRMIIRKPPPFSQRAQPDSAGPAVYVDVGRMPYEAVAPL